MWPSRSSVRSSSTSTTSPRLHGDVSVLVEEFADRDEAFGLVADVDDDVGFSDLEDRALDDLAFRHVPEAVVVNTKHGRKLLRIHAVVMHRLHSRACWLASPGACRCAGLFAHFLGRNQPVFYIRHSVRVLLLLMSLRLTSERSRAGPWLSFDIAQDIS